MAQRYRVTTLDALPSGSGREYIVAGQRVALFNVDGRIFAIGGECPHDGGPLAEGRIEGTTVTCPWHDAEFDITCGKVLCLPAVEDVKSYPVFVNGNAIEVEV